MPACQRCKQTTNGPQAFLLTCQGCSKTWHHRCHMPPIEDKELIQRIRATNAGDTANSLDAWMCRRCKKNKDNATGTTPSIASSVEPEKSVSSVSTVTGVPTKSEDDGPMDVDSSPPSHGRVSTSTASATQPAKTPPPVIQAIQPKPEPEPEPVEVPPVVSQPEVNPDVGNEADDDDSDDLYGPPVERRVIRILPFLAQELREQQRERRAPLAPDWILERHANDPSWNKNSSSSEVSRRRERKPKARRLGENGLNVDGLMGFFTIEDWVKKHKA